MTEAAATTGRRPWTIPDWMDLLLRFLVGGTFVYASFDKILDPAGFAQSIAHYRMAPAWLLHPAAMLLPWLELAAGAAMILGRARRGAAWLVILMLVMFMAAIGTAMARGLDISCGCFGTDDADAVGLSLLLRDLALLAGAAVLAAAQGIRRSF
ncbi:MAG: MauE/DoxX family redox-associated membrane protein [Candidatus Latescibacteria bacterium]|nr:MauE/DoxX family redox-associated membrane protein [Candidatus Latescibacterota bacterium]